MLNRIMLYYNTIKYLRPIQILYRFRQKLPSLKRYPSTMKTVQIPLRLYLEELDADEKYLARFDCEALLSDEIFLLNERHALCLRNWEIEGDTTHLWRFNLQYMEYLVPLAVCYQRTKEEKYYQKVKTYLEKWMDCFPVGSGDAWNAYTISERAVNWLIVMDLLEERLSCDEDFRQRVERSLYCQYQYLRTHQEKHLLGNHYFENLKALVLLSIAFVEPDLTRRYLADFMGQVREQVLPDGMHYERSFLYHNIILEDMIRVHVALYQTRRYEEIAEDLTRVLVRMAGCAWAFEGGLQRIPLFNDAGDNVAKPVEALISEVSAVASFEEKNTKGIDCLPNSGYYKYCCGDLTFLIDCGEIAPAYIPGHGHCDCLSYEMYFKGVPVLVNSGTYQYQSSKRDFFRSTQAHNCFTVDGFQQSQCWGEHRVAKRIGKVWAERNEKTFSGGCTFWNGIRVRRTIEFDEDAILVRDSCDNRENAVLQSYVHIAPGIGLSEVGEREYKLYDRTQDMVFFLQVLSADHVTVHQEDELCDYSAAFGSLEHKDVLEVWGLPGEEVVYKIHWRKSKW